MDPANEELSESYLKKNIFQIVDEAGLGSWSDHSLSPLSERVNISDGYGYFTGVKIKAVYYYGYANGIYSLFP